VGASAGGLEAFTRVLSPLSAEAPLALILVQHLARDHRSFLPSLLAKNTQLDVVEGRDKLRLAPGKVYVIRPDTRMTVIDGCLRVAPRPADRGYDAPIDRLFASLADQYREKAIGVVLSGGGSDGSEGLRAIKAVGGITVAQEPAEAHIDSMPRAAIATGSVELTLPASQIGIELERLSQHPFFRQIGPTSASESAPATEPDDLAPIFALLRRSSGVNFAQYKAPTIVRRIQRRMALHRSQGFPDYTALLEKDAAELAHLHDDILINVTGFFREPDSFEALRATILPQIVAARDDGHVPIRIWVPGCSSGEEAYSLAMTVTELLEEKGISAPLQIFGTDISQKMIDRARMGIYPDGIAADVSPERLQRFFVRFDGGYRVNPTIRQHCVFARQDITRDPPFSHLDLVVCRNLLIYLGEPLQRKVIAVFHYALKPSGFLMLGRSETVGLHAELFAMADSRWKIYRRKAGMADPREIEYLPRPRVPPEKPGPRAISSTAEPGATGDWEAQGEANRLLLDRFAPPSVIVDADTRIIRARGRTSRYFELPDGDATLDALKMVRPGLLSPLRSALDEVRDKGKPVRREGLRFHGDGELRLVTLEAIPIGRAEERHCLVVFEDAQATPPGASRATQGKKRPPASPTKPTTGEQQLQDELAATRAHLQSNIQELEAANEELQAANEEILSSNEEMQSTNEELDTAREELQSTNEELSTVNDELQNRNAELSLANGDLLNLLSNVQIPIVMVTPELKIRRFTPAAERLLNLIASDVGRPIRHITPNIKFPELERRIREVLDTVTAYEHEVDDQDGNTYLLRIRPYKTLDHRIDGAVLILIDISSALRSSREAGEAIMSTVRDPILMLDGDQTVKRANAAFFAKFRVAPGDTEGKRLYALGDGQWNIPALRQLLEEILPARRNFEGFVVEHTFPGIGRKRMLLDGRRIESGPSGAGIVLLIIRDVADA
jgi:two-component system CheB/CheR fusion protein